MNVKHGLGRESYANGDVYQGPWKQGVPDGFGRYVWRNGNEYLGNWRNGTMSGKGVLTCAGGDTFDGQWLDGLAHGHGTYTWKSGDKYVGQWSRGLKDGKGVFYPAGSRPQDVFRNGHSASAKEDTKSPHEDQRRKDRIKRPSVSDNEQYADRPSRRGSRSSSSGDGKVAEGQLRRGPSLERRWSLEGALDMVLGLDTGNPSLTGQPILEVEEPRDTRRHSLESVVPLAPPIVEREYVQGVLISEVLRDVGAPLPRSARRRQWRIMKDSQRPGETIYKGHRSYDLMMNLQLGIR